MVATGQMTLVISTEVFGARSSVAVCTGDRDRVREASSPEREGERDNVHTLPPFSCSVLWTPGSSVN